MGAGESGVALQSLPLVRAQDCDQRGAGQGVLQRGVVDGKRGCGEVGGLGWENQMESEVGSDHGIVRIQWLQAVRVRRCVLRRFFFQELLSQFS